MAISWLTSCLHVNIDEPGSTISHSDWKREDSGPLMFILLSGQFVKKPSVVTLTTDESEGKAFMSSPTTARINPVTCAAKNG